MKTMGWFLGLFACCWLLSQPAFAGGIWLYEGGTSDIGGALAGRAALGADASTATHNPAAMTRLERSQMVIALQGIQVNAHFDIHSATETGGDGGNAGGFVPVAAIHYVHNTSETIKLGISMGSYFGLGVDYGEDWAGRYYNQKSELLTMGVNPGLAYKINDTFSVGVGVSLVYATLDQSAAVNNIADSMDDGKITLEDAATGYGFNVGMFAEPSERLRFGVTYRSAVDLDFEDVLELENIGPALEIALRKNGLWGSEADVGITLPRAVMTSVVYKLNDTWNLMGNLGWQDWSDFGRQAISLSSGSEKSFTKDLEYDDTWHVALGAQYRFAPPWLLSFGMAYDSSPVEDEHRTADMPLDRQIRYATGIQYDLNDDITVGAAYVLIDAGSADLNLDGGPLQGDLEGDYSPNLLHSLAVNMSLKF